MNLKIDAILAVARVGKVTKAVVKEVAENEFGFKAKIGFRQGLRLIICLLYNDILINRKGN